MTARVTYNAQTQVSLTVIASVAHTFQKLSLSLCLIFALPSCEQYGKKSLQVLQPHFGAAGGGGGKWGRLHPWRVEVLQPGIEPVPQQLPKPLQWQPWIPKLLCHKRTALYTFRSGDNSRFQPEILPSQCCVKSVPFSAPRYKFSKLRWSELFIRPLARYVFAPKPFKY